MESSYSRSFSADTGMAEALIIATKKVRVEALHTKSVQHIILLELPQREMAAVETAQVVSDAREVFPWK